MPYRATSGLHLAAQNGDVVALQRLLSEGALVDLVSEIRYAVEESSDEERSSWRCTPLHAIWGAGYGLSAQVNLGPEHIKCIKLLIAHGADPNAVDNWGRNTLKIAVEAGLFSDSLSLIKTLIEAGAVVHEYGGHSVYSLTSKMLYLTMVNLGRLGKRDKGLEIISLLHKAGASTDGEHTNYGTLLEYAVWMNHRRLWPFFFRLGLAHPRPPESMPRPSITSSWYAPRRAHPYFGKIEAAGSFRNYERAHLRSLSAMFVPKFPRIPAEIVPLIVQFWAHVGDY